MTPQAPLTPQERIDGLRNVDGLRDPVALDQLCGRCQNRGYVQDHGRSENCRCAAGRFLTYREAALNTLTAMWGEREAQRWLEDRDPRTRERRLYMLRDDRASLVFEEIRREAAVRGVPPPVVPSFEESAAPRRASETLQDTAQERMVADFRRAGRAEAADLLLAGRAEEMADDDRAFLDAMVTGTGFLVDGKYVDPARVKVHRWGKLQK